MIKQVWLNSFELCDPGYFINAIHDSLKAILLAMVMHTSNQQGKEDEAGGSQVWGQPGLHLKNKAILFKKSASNMYFVQGIVLDFFWGSKYTDK
jgi:hypothetical protein